MFWSLGSHAKRGVSPTRSREIPDAGKAKLFMMLRRPMCPGNRSDSRLAAKTNGVSVAGSVADKREEERFQVGLAVPEEEEEVRNRQALCGSMLLRPD